MGLFVVYQKFKETETEVEYHYGHSATDLDMRLVLDKSDPTGPPKEGPYDPVTQKVIGLLNSRLAEIDRWPGGGAIQS